jgi:hypothetical protein
MLFKHQLSRTQDNKSHLHSSARGIVTPILIALHVDNTARMEVTNDYIIASWWIAIVRITSKIQHS